MAGPWFNVRKAAQVAAFFAISEGGRINVLKLVKLIYLADRAHMRDFGHPILDDELVSMPHGPVDSYTYNFINGMFGANSEWDEFIGARVGHDVPTRPKIDQGCLDELSDAEMATLGEVWAKFAAFNGFDLAAWTHKNCLEWEDPEGSSRPIPYERVFKFLGLDNSDTLAADVSEGRAIEKVFDSLRS